MWRCDQSSIRRRCESTHRGRHFCCACITDHNPGAQYLAVVAYTTPTTTTDHIVGMRFTFEGDRPSPGRRGRRDPLVHRDSRACRAPLVHRDSRVCRAPQVRRDSKVCRRHRSTGTPRCAGCHRSTRTPRCAGPDRSARNTRRDGCSGHTRTSGYPGRCRPAWTSRPPGLLERPPTSTCQVEEFASGGLNTGTIGTLGWNTNTTISMTHDGPHAPGVVGITAPTGQNTFAPAP